MHGVIYVQQNAKNGEKKRYVRIYFRDHNRKAKWYWAIKIKNKKYIRCKKDGDDFSYMRKCGTEIEKLYIMFGEPEKEIPFRVYRIF